MAGQFLSRLWWVCASSKVSAHFKVLCPGRINIVAHVSNIPMIQEPGSGVKEAVFGAALLSIERNSS
jgi:hypothetical protein